jgi:hypothetical protein
MTLFQLPNQVLLNYMRISLSGRNGGVAEKLLYHPNVHAVSEQERGDSVTQHVWRYVSFNTRVQAELSDYVRDTLS